MQRARALENNRQPVPGRGADLSAPRSHAADARRRAPSPASDLQSVATTTAVALGCPVAIAIPALGDPVVAPAGALPARSAGGDRRPGGLRIGRRRVRAARRGRRGGAVRIGEQMVGIVAAAAAPATRRHPPRGPSGHSWLEAAAAAASVTAVMRETHADGAADSGRRCCSPSWPPGRREDLPGFLVRARRLGVDLTGGAVAISARPVGWSPAPAARRPPLPVRELAARPGTLIAELRREAAPGRRPRPATGERGRPTWPPACCAGRDWRSAISAPRRDPALLHEAVREAELLAELAAVPGNGARRARRHLPAADRRPAARPQPSSSSCADTRSRRWPTTTLATTPTCWRRCARSSPTTARPPRPPRR